MCLDILSIRSPTTLNDILRYFNAKCNDNEVKYLCYDVQRFRDFTKAVSWKKGRNGVIYDNLGGSSVICRIYKHSILALKLL